MHNQVIRNGKIADGTGAPAFYGDIVIDGALLPRMKQIEFTGKLERLRSNFLARIKEAYAGALHGIASGCVSHSLNPEVKASCHTTC